jgi:HK97 family phage portal protein
VSLIRRGVETRAAANTFTQTYNPLNALYGQTSLWSSAGERVDEVTALGIASVLSCVSLLADSVATMPLRCSVMQNNGLRKPVPVPDVLADPDPASTNRFELIHSTMVSLALHGNGYILISRDGSGKPVGLTPLHPYQMNVMANKDGSGRTYLHLGHEIPTEDILHIRWFTPPQSLVGISPLLQQRTIMGLALATDRYLSQWYGEGATPSGVLQSDKPVTAEQARLLRETWEGSQRKHRRPAILSDGLKWQPITVSAVDMDFNNTADAIRAEVGRIFRVPSHLLNIKGDGQTYQNVEAASLNFLVYTLQPWITRLEIAFSQILPFGVDVEFDPSSLLRLDATTRARVDQTKVMTGVRTPNEIRLAEGLEPYVGGDKFIQVLPGAPVDPVTTSAGVDSDPSAALING